MEEMKLRQKKNSRHHARCKKLQAQRNGTNIQSPQRLEDAVYFGIDHDQDIRHQCIAQRTQHSRQREQIHYPRELAQVHEPGRMAKPNWHADNRAEVGLMRRVECECGRRLSAVRVTSLGRDGTHGQEGPAGRIAGMRDAVGAGLQKIRIFRWVGRRISAGHDEYHLQHGGQDQAHAAHEAVRGDHGLRWYCSE